MLSTLCCFFPFRFRNGRGSNFGTKDAWMDPGRINGARTPIGEPWRSEEWPKDEDAVKGKEFFFLFSLEVRAARHQEPIK